MFNSGLGLRRWSNGGLGTWRLFNDGFRLRRGMRGRGGLDWNWIWLNNDYFACWFLCGNVEKYIYKYHVIRNVYTLCSHVQTDTLPLLFLDVPWVFPALACIFEPPITEYCIHL